MKKIGQKIFGALVLAIFVLSIIPTAFAATGNEARKLNIMAVKKLEEVKNEEKPRLNAIVNAKIQAENKLLKAREQLMNVRERYEDAKEKFLDAKRLHLEQKEKVEKARNTLRECREETGDGEDTEECIEKKDQLKLGYFKHLTKSSEVLLKSLDRLSTKVEEMKDISDENKEEALGDITALKVRIEEFMRKVESFDENTTAEELRDATEELKELKLETKRIHKRVIAMLITSKLSKLVEKHEEFRNGMELRINSLREDGIDVSELEELLEEFDEKVEDMNEHYAFAAKLWRTIDDARDFDEFIKEWHDAQKEVRKDLKETKRILREFIQKYKDLRREFNSDDSDDADEEDEEEDDADEEDEEDNEDSNEDTTGEE